MLKDEEEIKGFGYCDYHEEPIDESTYEWKGCWGCHYFSEGRDFPYTFVSSVSKEFGVSESTVRRRIKKGTLKGRLFVQIRYTGFLPSPTKYHVEKESVEELREKMKRAEHKPKA